MVSIGKIFIVLMIAAAVAIFVASRIDAKRCARIEAEDRALRQQRDDPTD